MPLPNKIVPRIPRAALRVKMQIAIIRDVNAVEMSHAHAR